MYQGRRDECEWKCGVTMLSKEYEGKMMVVSGVVKKDEMCED
jgi:hypothetical protein